MLTIEESSRVRTRRGASAHGQAADGARRAPDGAATAAEAASGTLARVRTERGAQRI